MDVMTENQIRIKIINGYLVRMNLKAGQTGWSQYDWKVRQMLTRKIVSTSI